jgi:hypothetical protein
MHRPHPIWSFLRNHVGVLAVLVIACGAGLWFAADIVLDFVYFNDPRHQDEAIMPWMTPRYVGMSYDLPREVIHDIFGLDADGPRGMTMRNIAAEHNMTLHELTEKVRITANEFRAEHPQ